MYSSSSLSLLRFTQFPLFVNSIPGDAVITKESVFCYSHHHLHYCNIYINIDINIYISIDLSIDNNIFINVDHSIDINIYISNGLRFDINIYISNFFDRVTSISASTSASTLTSTSASTSASASASAFLHLLSHMAFFEPPVPSYDCDIQQTRFCCSAGR